jgi:hypothetical protein
MRKERDNTNSSNTQEKEIIEDIITAGKMGGEDIGQFDKVAP